MTRGKDSVRNEWPVVLVSVEEDHRGTRSPRKKSRTNLFIVGKGLSDRTDVHVDGRLYVVRVTLNLKFIYYFFKININLYIIYCFGLGSILK